MKNYIQPGNAIDCVAPSGGVTSGKPFVSGSLRGFVAGDAAEGESFALHRVGVYSYTKATGAAWTQGDKVYYHAGNDEFTKTATGATLFGFAAAAAASGDTTGSICLADTL